MANGANRVGLIERLEARTLLSWVPHDMTVAVYFDANRNGVRDAGEHGMPGWKVEATLLYDNTGRNIANVDPPMTQVTDAAGETHFVGWADNHTYPGFAGFRVPLSNRYWFTTDDKPGPTWDPKDPRGNLVNIGVSNIGQVAGQVLNQFNMDGSAIWKRELAGRRVFEDLNRNGRYDRNEPNALTNIGGTYWIYLTAGTHTLRVEDLAGWGRPKGEPTSKTFQVVPGPIEAPDFTVSMSKPVVIDVAATYTKSAMFRLARDKQSFLLKLRTMFADANKVYANSNTNVILRPVAIAATSYKESDSIHTDLTRLHDARDGKVDDALTLRKTSHADLVVLFTDGKEYRGDVVGEGYEYLAGPHHEDRAFSVGALQDDEEDWITLAHEVAHNLGAGHDKPHANVAAPAKYAYGFIHEGADADHSWRDIMAFGPQKPIPFFSTPDFLNDGVQVGHRKTADNARMIREAAPIVAAYG
jgi:hypothetical protein